MTKNYKNRLGLRIKELRIANKLTQEKLAEMLDMERTNLARIESGIQFTSPENLEKFAKIFNVSPYELFNFNHQKSKEALIQEITEELNAFSLEKVQYIYKSTMNLKSVK